LIIDLLGSLLLTGATLPKEFDIMIR